MTTAVSLSLTSMMIGPAKVPSLGVPLTVAWGSRFDHVYAVLFKCNQRYIHEYLHLSNYVRDVYQIAGMALRLRQNLHHAIACGLGGLPCYGLQLHWTNLLKSAAQCLCEGNDGSAASVKSRLAWTCDQTRVMTKLHLQSVQLLCLVRMPMRLLMAWSGAAA